MGGVKDREEKKKRNHVFSSGGGGGTKGPAKIDKRNQDLYCPQCERVFKQVQRLRDHIDKHHADTAEAAAAEAAPQPSGPKNNESIMDIGSRGGAWTKKSPRLLLQEWTQSNKRPKPRCKAIRCDDGRFRCKVVLPDLKDNEKDIVVFLAASAAAEAEDEALQLGALAALHRVAGDRAMHRVLPHAYTPAWERFSQEAEAQQQRASLKLAAGHRRMQQEKARQAAEARKKPAQVVMSEPQRRLIESAISDLGLDETHGHRAGLKAVLPDDAVASHLGGLGFSKEDVTWAYDNLSPAATAPQLLDWLCLHLPEERLPRSFAPAARAQPAAVRAFQPHSLIESSDGAVELASFGYSSQDISDALSSCGHNTEAAFGTLFTALIGRDAMPASDTTLSDEWREEMGALRAIYGADLTVFGTSHLKVLCDDGRTVLDLRLPSSGAYPAVPPLLAMQCPGLSRRVLLGATKLLSGLADSLVQSPMCHDLILAAPAFLRQASKADVPPVHVAAAEGTQPEQDSSPCVNAEPAGSKAPAPMSRPPSSGQRHAHPPRLSSTEARRESLRLRQAREVCLERLTAVHEFRRALPAFGSRPQVLTKLKNHNVLVISGTTGCGKSTQIPQYILEDAIDSDSGGFCNIVCTQPRRISAIGLADRVSQERGEDVGRVVGYAVRLESKTSRQTRLLFCTTGILLRRMLSDQDLDGVSHVVVDEVHERSVDCDLLLYLLRELLLRKGASAPKILLMSATTDAQYFAQYFSPASTETRSTATLHIPGFTHPVQDLFLEDALEVTGFKIGRTSRYSVKKLPQTSSVQSEALQVSAKDCHEEDNWGNHERAVRAPASCVTADYSQQTMRSLANADEAIINYELIEVLLACVMSKEIAGRLADTAPASARALLVFLPGAPEIDRLIRVLKNSTALARAAQGRKLLILPLHGSLSPQQQAKVFERPAADTQKIVVSTNVAETSVTIDDIVCVIDSGRVKEMRYDSVRGLSRLEETWVSTAAAVQRRGRAGRVQPGTCIKLFSRRLAAGLQGNQSPEVLRVPLHQLCLTLRAALPERTPVASGLQGLLDPPPPASAARAMAGLSALGALGEGEALTMLGRHLVSMPMDPKMGKALIYGALLRQVFVSPPDQREEARAAKAGLTNSSTAAGKSDHIAIIAAFNIWHGALKAGGRREALQVSKRLFLSEPALEAILAGRADFAAALSVMGFVDQDYLGNLGQGTTEHKVDEFSGNARFVKAAICAGFYPSILRVEHGPEVYSKTHGGAVSKEDAPTKLRFFDRLKGRVFMHPSSVLFDVGRFETPWLIYTDMVETSKVFCREASMVPLYSLLLFGGRISVDHQASLIKLDDWATFKAPARVAVLIKELRAEIDRLLLLKVENMKYDISNSKAVDALHRLLATDGF